MSNPKVEINIRKLIANTKTIVDLAKNESIEVMGVGKAVCADLEVAKAMLAGGVKGLADSRIENLEYLRKNLDLSGLELMLLRIPMLSEVSKVVKYADISLNSEIKIIKALDKEAKKANKRHKIILMVDVGDRREGIMPENVISVVDRITNLSNIELVGLGTNLACFGGVLPSDKNMQLLIDLTDRINNKFGLNLKHISGGNSSSLPRLKEKGLPDSITQLRVGETILIGSNVINREPFPGTCQDAFLLRAEIVELKDKPAQPEGARGQNAFGEESIITKTGIRKRAILGIGRQDIDIDGLIPIDKGVEVEGGSSDHLIVDVTDFDKSLAVGDTLKFKLNYSSLLSAMTSQYVDITYHNLNQVANRKVG
ncbi:alanine/ornithine racemase family PLP-dependent enzyme [Selenihalanaerobacter shriftii]|uniref:Predicted amino acid racemase n=1 Tax=Selenihalanaerobacter shriftii TaxID=142842 RepID=A0A1T4PWV4_9FIRM|nr:alanine/ornithine racemase family PLP-dependent enzyme [Selenihalanaerobacter shriftii]SJZ95949.1 Predicted amino acid racemase [Selenihalanaerobacter shriftii]